MLEAGVGKEYWIVYTKSFKTRCPKSSLLLHLFI